MHENKRFDIITQSRIAWYDILKNRTILHDGSIKHIFVLTDFKFPTEKITKNITAQDFFSRTKKKPRFQTDIHKMFTTDFAIHIRKNWNKFISIYFSINFENKFTKIWEKNSQKTFLQKIPQTKSKKKHTHTHTHTYKKFTRFNIFKNDFAFI